MLLLMLKKNQPKGEIPNITNLATTTVLTAMENKIRNVSNLVKNTESNTNINEIERLLITIIIHILLLQNVISLPKKFLI